MEKCLWTLVLKHIRFLKQIIDLFKISNAHIGFTKGYTVGFGGQSYTWDKGFELAEKFLLENITVSISSNILIYCRYGDSYSYD